MESVLASIVYSVIGVACSVGFFSLAAYSINLKSEKLNRISTVCCVIAFVTLVTGLGLIVIWG